MYILMMIFKSTLSNFLRYKVIAMTKHFFLKSRTEKLLPTFNASMKNWPERDLTSELYKQHLVLRHLSKSLEKVSDFRAFCFHLWLCRLSNCKMHPFAPFLLIISNLQVLFYRSVIHLLSITV